MNEEFDDSALLVHRAAYDPVKAREYYLRTRHLKGRRQGVVTDPRVGRPSHAVAIKGGGHIRPSRRQHLMAEKAALEKRLERLRNVLEELVAAAKRRSGVKVHDKKQTPAEQAKAKAATKKSAANSKPLTAAEKAKKRKDSREAYAKENGTNLAQDVQQLHAQVQDIRAQIEKALADARKQAARTNHQTASKGR